MSGQRSESDVQREGGKTESLWGATVHLSSRPPLREDLNCDVCVVGAGIAGLSTAYLLASEGKSVAVIDDGLIGAGETGRTTAHLSNALDDRYFHLERLHGHEGSRLAAASHGGAIDRIESIVREERIDCGFERLDGYLFVPPGESEQILHTELEAARRAGVAGVELLKRVPNPSSDMGPCLRFPRQAQFHPLTYLSALVAALERTGSKVYGQ